MGSFPVYRTWVLDAQGGFAVHLEVPFLSKGYAWGSWLIKGFSALNIVEEIVTRK
jgi:hypothetical protein